MIKRDVGSAAPHRGARDVASRVSVVDVARGVVELDVLEDQHRIRIGERRTEHPVGVLDRRRREHLDPRNVGVPALQAVRVLGGELPTRAGGHPDHERHGELPAGHVSQRRRGVDDLVERQQAEVDRHHLDDRAQPAQRRADPDADEPQLRQRRVAHPLGPELLEQALGRGIGAAVAADVLAHQDDAWIVAQGIAHGVVDRGSR